MASFRLVVVVKLEVTVELRPIVVPLARSDSLEHSQGADRYGPFERVGVAIRFERIPTAFRSWRATFLEVAGLWVESDWLFHLCSELVRYILLAR